LFPEESVRPIGFYHLFLSLFEFGKQLVLFFGLLSEHVRQQFRVFPNLLQLLRQTFLEPDSFFELRLIDLPELLCRLFFLFIFAI
jgi:hypothetical protein